MRVGTDGAQASVVVPNLRALPEAPPPPPPQGPVTTTRGWQRVLGLVVAGVGVGGVAVGTGFGLSAIKKNDRADEHCPPVGCDQEGLSVGKTADDHAFVSTISIVAGAVFIIGGAVLFFTATSTTRSTATLR